MSKRYTSRCRCYASYSLSNECLRTCSHVLLLRTGSYGSKIQEVSVVEEVSHTATNSELTPFFSDYVSFENNNSLNLRNPAF